MDKEKELAIKKGIKEFDYVDKLVNSLIGCDYEEVIEKLKDNGIKVEIVEDDWYERDYVKYARIDTSITYFFMYENEYGGVTLDREELNVFGYDYGNDDCITTHSVDYLEELITG